MTTSGTVGQTSYRVADLVDSIARRCGVEPTTLTPESVGIVLASLWRILAQMSNRGINLWRIYTSLVGLVNGQQQYPLAQGDIDTMGVVLRTPTRLSASTITSSSGGTTANLVDGDITTVCTQSAPNGDFVFDWGVGVEQQVALVGVLPEVATSLKLVFEISDDNINWTQISATGTQSYTGLTPWRWFEIEPAGQPARYFRVRETGGATLSLEELVLAARWTDVEVTRWNIDQWRTNPSKRSGGPPRQFYLDRQITPVLNAWPTPDATQNLNLLVMQIHRHIEDVGNLSNTLGIPQRWYGAVITMTAFDCISELPKADLKRYDMLKDQALMIQLPDAEKEERDKSAVQLVIGIGAYTK